MESQDGLAAPLPSFLKAQINAARKSNVNDSLTSAYPIAAGRTRLARNMRRITAPNSIASGTISTQRAHCAASRKALRSANVLCWAATRLRTGHFHVLTPDNPGHAFPEGLATGKYQIVRD